MLRIARESWGGLSKRLQLSGEGSPAVPLEKLRKGRPDIDHGHSCEAGSDR